MSNNGLQKKKRAAGLADEAPLVDEQRFILSTRDTGYRSTASAVAELVDNAVQAGARNISLFISQEGLGVERELRVAVLDDGCGMDAVTLTTALRFGGSSRFDDRSGAGRFGMGLPNSSVSQAKRLEVYTWRRPSRVLYSHLNVEEIAAGRQRGVPAPTLTRLPDWVRDHARFTSGTLIIWDQCDRLDYRKATTITAKLQASLGRKFRYFLWDGVRITVNGELTTPVDPLCLRPAGDTVLAVPYGEPLTYEVRVPNDPSQTSTITVRFSELQVAKLHGLSVEEKRRLGISKGAGVSIVRAKREIDYGWYFMGSKRKENYDDWWRCEIMFDPPLDEYFGVTHSKQQIRPKEDLLSILVPDLEAVAHTLNSRVRAAFTAARSVGEPKTTPAAETATASERLLPPIVPNGTSPQSNGRAAPRGQKPTKKTPPPKPADLRYKIDKAPLRCPDFYTWEAKQDGVVWVTLNTNHPFFEEVYEPSCSSEKIRFALECLILASVRADMTAKGAAEEDWSRRRLVSLSNALAAYLGQ